MRNFLRFLSLFAYSLTVLFAFPSEGKTITGHIYEAGTCVGISGLVVKVNPPASSNSPQVVTTTNDHGAFSLDIKDEDKYYIEVFQGAQLVFDLVWDSTKPIPIEIVVRASGGSLTATDFCPLPSPQDIENFTLLHKHSHLLRAEGFGNHICIGIGDLDLKPMEERSPNEPYYRRFHLYLYKSQSPLRQCPSHFRLKTLWRDDGNKRWRISQEPHTELFDYAGKHFYVRVNRIDSPRREVELSVGEAQSTNSQAQRR